MEIDRKDLDRAARDGLLTMAQAEALWAAIAARSTGAALPEPVEGRRSTSPGRAGIAVSSSRPARPFRAALALLVALAAAGNAAWLLVLAFERLGGAGGFAVAAAYGLALLKAGSWVSRRSEGAAGGLLIAAAVAMVPVAVHGVEHWLGFAGGTGGPPETLAALVRSHTFPPAIAAVAAAALALRSFPFPLLSAVLVAAVWFVVIGCAPIIFGPDPTWGQRALLSALLGLVVLGAGVAVDGRTRRDHARWIYLAGLVAFWGGLTTYHAETGPSFAFGAAVNASLLVVSLLLGRRGFAIFGAVGLAAVLGHLAEVQLEDAAVPFAFAAIGLALVGGGIAWHRFEPSWSRALIARFPERLRILLPPPQRARR